MRIVSVSKLWRNEKGFVGATSQPEINQLLEEARRGDQTAVDALFEAVYVELRRMARDYLRDERTDHTLQPTALVHEAYLRLIGGQEIVWQNRAQFFSIASQVMRHILVDHARRHSADKRGHGAGKLSLDDAVDLAAARNIDLVALDDALVTLATLDEEQSKIVELRFFGGLTIKEIAEILEISEMTVSRKWKTARLWLHQQVSRNEDDQS
ncbi:MAG TPA: sigma-70 family RNA polymerase sigma factor [Pyrinomonadaceae bacterium]|nr:sigma-70 family RNA polymerase sigma factor [Pyrinomonadaceae bacterium]